MPLDHLLASLVQNLLQYAAASSGLHTGVTICVLQRVMSRQLFGLVGQFAWTQLLFAPRRRGVQYSLCHAESYQGLFKRTYNATFAH